MIFQLRDDPTCSIGAAQLSGRAHYINRDLQLGAFSQTGEPGIARTAPDTWLVYLHGETVTAAEGSWLVRAPSGRLELCDPETFTDSYIPAETEQAAA